MGSETIDVRGADALTYLDAQVTQALGALAAGGRAETLLLDPSGTITTVAVVRRDAGGAVSLEVPEGTAAAAVARLERFAIRADVAFTARRTAAPDAWFADERARIEAEVPGASELAHALVPHALSPALLERTVSFTKGCYPGQELVARMQARHATPPYVLRGIVAAGLVAAGDPAGGDDRAGSVTSAAPGPDGTTVGLCVLHRRDAAEATVAVRHGADAVVARLVGDPSVRS